MVTFPFGETVTLHRRVLSPKPDQDGNDVYIPTDIPIPGCAFDPGGSVESVQGQDMVTTKPTVYAPPGTVVLATDGVTVRGLPYEVDGAPSDYISPFTGWNPGVVVRLKAVTG